MTVQGSVALAVGSPEVWAAAVAASGVVAAALVPVVQAALRARRALDSSPVANQVLLPSRARLVDRTNEVSKVLRHLQQGEFLVAIEGSLGTGKSAIAAEVAHRLVPRVGAGDGPAARQGRRYRWLAWIDARNGCPTVAEVADQLSLLTGDQGLAVASAENKEAVLRSFLAGQPSVLVIDNVRFTASGTQDFTRFMRTLPSGSVAVVSANTPGRLNAPRIIVEELQLDFMREMLRREADRLEVPSVLDADEETLGEVHRLIGGNPRAIGLLVLACSRQPATLREVLDQLRSGEGPVIDELFSTVWDGITPEDRFVLAVCSYLKGQAVQEQIESALDVSRDVLRQRIERLWADGLLTRSEQQGSTCYTVTPMMCGFVLKHTPEETISGIALRLSRYLIRKFRDAWEDAAGAIPHLPAIRHLVEELNARGEPGLCLDLFEVSLDIFFTLGLFDDRIRLGWIAHDAACRSGDAVRSSLALSVISSTHSLRGEYAVADHAIDLGMRVAREAGSDQEVARQIRCRAYNVFRSGDARQALETVGDAEEMALNSGDLNNLVDIIALRSAAEWHLGDFDACRATVSQFLHYCQVIPWERAKAYPIREKAELAMMARSYGDAALLLKECREIAEKYRDERQLVRIALSESRHSLFTGRLLTARQRARSVEAEAGRLGLLSEHAEASAVSSRAGRAMAMPWRWRRSTRSPVPRFTEMTIGGD